MLDDCTTAYKSFQSQACMDWESFIKGVIEEKIKRMKVDGGGGR